MRIVNNKIYIIRGETPTYNVSVKYRDTGAPFMLVESDRDRIHNPIIEFVVRPSIYSRDDDYVFRTYMMLEGDTDAEEDYPYAIHWFDSSEIVPYPGMSMNPAVYEWDDEIEPVVGKENYLYYLDVGGIREYRYYNDDLEDNKWVPYDFRISFQFPYKYTSVLENKTYKYEIALIGGNPVEHEDDELPISIDYKRPLMEANDFIVGGSLSE